MTTHPAKSTPKSETPKPTKLEVVEPSPAPAGQAVSDPENTNPKKEESEPTRPYTITAPVRVIKLVQLVSKTSGVSASDIWLDAIEKAGLKEKARAALAALAADLGD